MQKSSHLTTGGLGRTMTQCSTATSKDSVTRRRVRTYSYFLRLMVFCTCSMKRHSRYHSGLSELCLQPVHDDIIYTYYMYIYIYLYLYDIFVILSVWKCLLYMHTVITGIKYVHYMRRYKSTNRYRSLKEWGEIQSTLKVSFSPSLMEMKIQKHGWKWGHTLAC